LAFTIFYVVVAASLVAPFPKRTPNKSFFFFVVAAVDAAQCFAVELSTNGSGTQVLIGGGYGLAADSRVNNSLEEALSDYDESTRALLEQQNNLRGMSEWGKDFGCAPKPFREVFEVHIPDLTKQCFFDKVCAGAGWEWEVFNTKRVNLPRPNCMLQFCSPSLHWVPNIVEEDFQEGLPGGAVKANDEKEALGRRVVMHGLLGRSDLNGRTARCGPWLETSGRYPVSVFGTKRETVAVKPTNLRYATDPLTEENVVGLISSSGGGGVVDVGPRPILGVWLNESKGSSRSPLDPPDPDVIKSKHGGSAIDSYRGPLSSQASAVLNYCCRQEGGVMKYLRLPLEAVKTKTGTEYEKMVICERFVQERVSLDQSRTQSWADGLVARRNESLWSKMVSLKVKLDSVYPPVERELLVSPFVTVAVRVSFVFSSCFSVRCCNIDLCTYFIVIYLYAQELHHQVLAPAIGWAANFHAYAIRRKRRVKSAESRRLALKSLKEECWVGPRHSTALDVFFQPLYVGGAVASDREILLGDLIFDSASSCEEFDLQYVYDFGDWWSHTIEFEPFTGEIPAEGSTTAAILLSGRGVCPAEDTHGPILYSEKVQQLCGWTPIETTTQATNSSTKLVDPSDSEWWEFVAQEWRGKNNTPLVGNPLRFDLEERREALNEALRNRLHRAGTEARNLSHFNFESGLAGTAAGPGGDKRAVRKTRIDPLKQCAVCGVTAGLMLCSACHGVAFCGREHQLQYWPQHKAACKEARKNLSE